MSCTDRISACRLLLALLCAAAVLFSPAQSRGQQKEEMKKQAETELKKMSPDEIQAKIKEAGLTQEEASKRAAELGISLDEYLQKQPASAPASEKKSEQVKPQKTEGDPTGIPAQQQTPAQREALPPPPLSPHGVPYFGYNIFSGVPEAFEPTPVGPVDPGYLVGPGDVLRLIIWGEVEFQHELTVDNEGRVVIPNIGLVLVSGFSLEKLEQKLKAQLSQSYSGLRANPPTVFMDVSVVRMRPTRVFVMGELARPGGYVVSSYATVFGALYSVGGPLVSGTLREVKVVRNNKTVAVVDLYGYLLRGDQQSDVRLQNNDLVFIPPRGKSVAIIGEVRRPAVYELKPNENLRALLDFSGGLRNTAYADRVTLERIKPIAERIKGEPERKFLEVELIDYLKDTGRDFTLQDGDKIVVGGILEGQKNVVTIQGAVLRPGAYDYSKNRTLRELVLSADGITGETFLERADITRVRADQSKEFLQVNLERALQGDPEHNVELRDHDLVRVYNMNEMKKRLNVSIHGHVWRPGEYPFAENMTVYDLIFQAGGMMDSTHRKTTFMERADIIRINEDRVTRSIINFDLGKLLAGDQLQNHVLREGDQVYIYGKDVVEFSNSHVSIFGNVKSPGRFPLAEGMTVQDLVFLAGGYTEDANTLTAEISRIRRGGLGGDTLATLYVSRLHPLADVRMPEEGIESEYSSATFALENRDVVFIRRNPDFKVENLVTLEGEVLRPGRYALRHVGERLSNLIKRAGGPTRFAHLPGAIFLRNGQRMIVDFEEALEGDEDHDIELRKEDEIHIPVRPNAVQVVGAVRHPGTFKYVEGQSLKRYIERAGGRVDSADIAIVFDPSGATFEEAGFLGSNPKIRDGAIIRVEHKVRAPEGPSTDWAGVIKDTFAILTSAATVAFIVWQVTK